MVEVSVAHSKEDIEALLDLGGEIDIAVAYIDEYGMNIIRDKVKANTDGIKKVRLLVDLKGGVTHPDAVKEMVELSEEEGDRFECKEYYIKEDGHAGLHSKLLLSNIDGSVTFLTGSCNLTENAIKRNKEHGVRVECRADTSLAKEVLHYFRELWESSHASKITHERYSEYAEIYKEPQVLGGGVLSSPKDVNYWLFKCNAALYTFDKLLKKSTDYWNGIENPLALKRLREKVKKGDGVLFYHSGPNHQQVVGTARVVTDCYDGLPAWADPESNLYNPSKSNEPVPTVNIRVDRKFVSPVPLRVIQRMGLLKGAADQTTILPVTPEKWDKIIRIGMDT